MKIEQELIVGVGVPSSAAARASRSWNTMECATLEGTLLQTTAGIVFREVVDAEPAEIYRLSRNLRLVVR